MNPLQLVALGMLKMAVNFLPVVIFTTVALISLAKIEKAEQI